MRVIIVGAGPAGLILALLLLRSGIEVEVLDKEDGATNDRRATFYQPVSMFEFERAGIADDVKKAGMTPNAAAMKDLQGNRLGTIPNTGQIALPVGELTRIMQARFAAASARPIAWSHEVVDVGQDEKSAWVEVKTPTGQQKMTADFVVGCDGGQSSVRRKLFGVNALHGFTWDRDLTTTDFVYEFPESADLDDSNLILDPIDAVVLHRVTKARDQWRAIWQESKDDKAAKDVEHARQTLARLLPGHPLLETSQIQDTRTYQIHQRIVDSMVSGRIVLVGDAAHLCCPYGAFGLNGAVADVGSLAVCLAAIEEGKADISILKLYSDVRREKWETITNPQSQGVLKMVYSDPERLKQKPPGQQSRPQGPGEARPMPNTMALQYDFSQHFK